MDDITRAPSVSNRAVYEAMYDILPDAIFQVSGSGNITWANKQASEMFGYSRDELVALSIDSLVPEHLRSMHRLHRKKFQLAPTTRAMRTSSSEFTAVRKDGSEFPIDIRLSATDTPMGKTILAAVRDISHTKESAKKQ